MKGIIYKSKFQEITKSMNENFFVISWHDTIDMVDAEYREEILEQLDCYQKYMVKGSLIDTSNFEFAIVPDTQDWANINIFPPASEAGLKYIALLVAKDFYAQLSIEQYTSEDKDNLLEFRYFDSLEQARTWLEIETSKP